MTATVNIIAEDKVHIEKSKLQLNFCHPGLKLQMFPCTQSYQKLMPSLSVVAKRKT